ncbi:putative aldose 1-epimerase [Talaromyces proteolyticus]|uniref:Aldose 1-epimerase n=1 Tax=Talaromyces proteolyticus TaxID=1131652 RepID=A0AAD4KEF4_9EURO|nr:putative aldose 1-epimerase [Talaromyces proteolyticus]KAH8688857.1 putative aldose 1-epimerase [Talaromyces proteolyticus]
MADSAFTFLPLGAIIQEFNIDGTNIVQGFRTQDDYVKHNSPFFGATVGRVANRLKNAQLENVNGQTYSLAANDAPNALHGGPQGWDKKVFAGPKAVSRGGKEGVFFKYVSKHGEENYPGTVEVRVWYTAGKEEGKTVLVTEYEAELVGDEVEETAVNITNHSYFNISGAPTIAGTTAQLATDLCLPLDDTSIPFGHVDRFSKVDVARPFVLGTKENEVDDCFLIETDPTKVPLDTRDQPVRLLGSFSHDDTKIHLEVYSTEPAFQFYTGNGIDVPAVNGVPARGKYAGFCVEPSRYVNAANVPAWRHMTLLKRGQVYGSKIVYKAWRDTQSAS